MKYSIELMRNGRKEPVVAYTEFALLIQKDPDALFCFFEGKDQPYYLPRIKHYYSGTYAVINCNGRESTVQVHALIEKHSEYDRYKKAFFIDKDFNQPLIYNQPNIYETEAYSIENYYISRYVFKDILTSELNISEVESCFVTCLNLYINRQEEFHASTLLFNAWYACLIDLRNRTHEKTGVHLDSKFPKGFIDISLLRVSSSYDLNSIEERFPTAIKINEKEIIDKQAELTSMNLQYALRGKYALEFMLKILNLLIIDANSSMNFVKKRVKYHIDANLALSTFSGYAETPPKLIEFIKAYN